MSNHVLIVEDNQDQTELIRIALKRSSFNLNPTFEENGREALKICKKEHFDAIVLDYKLPDLSGLDVLINLRKQKIHTPVIIITGQGDEKIAVEAMKNGAADYIVKEVNYLKSLPKVISSIIDRYNLERKLKEKEEFLANVVENANDIIFSLDKNYNFRFLNHRINKLHYKPEELISKSFFTILSNKHTPETTISILKSPEEKNYEFEFVDKSNKTFNHIVSFNRLAQNGDDDVLILGIAKDMTKTLHLYRLIQESKNKLQTLFDSITDYIIVLDKNKNIVMANKKVASLKNTTPDRILGLKCFTLYSKTESICPGCIVDKTWKTQKPEFMEQQRDNHIYHMWTYPMFNLDGELEFVIENLRDVTEQKNFERKLIQSEKLATIGLLASGVAHELRNPLNIIETARYYLQDVMKNSDKDLTSKLEIINRNVKRSSNIIDNLLEFSRNSAKEYEAFNVNELIDKTLSLIEKDLCSQNIEVIKHYNEVPKAILNIDSLKQVFLNIIINAIHAMSHGGELTIYTESLDDKWIQIRFVDTGVGISKENLNNIFTPFFTTKESGKGTGLGMYVSHSIIKREGGDIWVNSIEGEGTTFTVQLPMKEN